MAKKRVYKIPGSASKNPVGRYGGNSPTYRRNQTGDYSSNHDRYKKGAGLVPSLIDQGNPYLFGSPNADDGYWRVWIVKATCRDNCGGCSGETGKIVVHPGNRPLKCFIAVGPGIAFQAGFNHIQLHKWDRIPQTFDDLATYRKWYSDLPYNAVVTLPPGIWSVSARNPSGYWDTVCLGLGRVAQGLLTLEMSSYD